MIYTRRSIRKFSSKLIDENIISKIIKAGKLDLVISLLGEHNGRKGSLADRLWNIDELSSYLNLKRQTIYSMVSGKRIPYVKLGGRLLFNPKEISRWVSQKSEKEII